MNFSESSKLADKGRSSDVNRGTLSRRCHGKRESNDQVNKRKQLLAIETCASVCWSIMNSKVSVALLNDFLIEWCYQHLETCKCKWYYSGSDKSLERIWNLEIDKISDQYLDVASRCRPTWWLHQCSAFSLHTDGSKVQWTDAGMVGICHNRNAALFICGAANEWTSYIRVPRKPTCTRHRCIILQMPKCTQ